jgi:hypothetical protein
MCTKRVQTMRDDAAAKMALDLLLYMNTTSQEERVSAALLELQRKKAMMYSHFEIGAQRARAWIDSLSGANMKTEAEQII